MPHKKNCDEVIGEGAAFIEENYSQNYLHGFMGSEGSRESLAQLILVKDGRHPKFEGLIDQLVKPGGTCNRPARISAVKDMLKCIGFSNGWLESERDSMTQQETV